MHYSKSNTSLQVGNMLLNRKRMQTELNELRYYFEQNVAQRTVLLITRIALLESCNATLCDKLAMSQEELNRFRAVQRKEVVTSQIVLHARAATDQAGRRRPPQPELIRNFQG